MLHFLHSYARKRTETRQMNSCGELVDENLYFPVCTAGHICLIHDTFLRLVPVPTAVGRKSCGFPL